MPRRVRKAALAGLAAIPGVFALGIAYLYFFGAVEKWVQLREADVDPPSLMPLVPIEQLLAGGIGQLTMTALVLAIGWLAFLVFTPGSPDPPQKPVSDGQIRKVLLAITILAVVFLPPKVFGPVLITMVIAYGVWIQTNYWGPRYISRYIAMGIALQASLALSQAWLNPEPLPKATLSLKDGSSLERDLLFTTSTGWYLADDDPGDPETRENNALVIPLGQVEQSTIDPQERDDGESLFQHILP